MRQKKWEINRPEELPEVARDLLGHFSQYRVFGFRGDLGAGKTTFIQALCTRLGSRDPVVSPTFTLINEYLGKDDVIYHMDVYRLEKVEEALDIGWDEYMDSGRYCFVEWPQLVERLMPAEWVLVQIHDPVQNGSTNRIITATLQAN